MNPINATEIAEKLRCAETPDDDGNTLAADMKRQPRLLEVLWFLQWWSQTERGLSALVKAMVAAFPARFVTREMTEAGRPAHGGKYSDVQCHAIWKSTFDRRGFERIRLTRAADAPLSNDFEEWLISNFPHKLTVAQWPTAAPSHRRAIEHGRERFNYAFQEARCVEAALAEMEESLLAIVRDDVIDSGLWFCPAPPRI